MPIKSDDIKKISDMIFDAHEHLKQAKTKRAVLDEIVSGEGSLEQRLQSRIEAYKRYEAVAESRIESLEFCLSLIGEEPEAELEDEEPDEEDTPLTPIRPIMVAASPRRGRSATVKDLVAKVLSGKPSGLGGKEVYERVIATGKDTTSDTVYTTLSLLKKEGRVIYQDRLYKLVA